MDQAVQNALYTVELCQQAIPVYRGMPAPLIRPLFTAQFVHGQDGMGDIGLPLTGRQPAAGHAVSVLVETIHRFAGNITLVTLGPLTNVASPLRQDPLIAKAVKECVIMGGTGQGHGNITPVGEYNFWADPEAAKIVFESGMRIKNGWLGHLAHLCHVQPARYSQTSRYRHAAGDVLCGYSSNLNLIRHDPIQATGL